MYQALYRTLRPQVFSDLLGQDHIVKILTNQLRTGEVSHAYLFCGTRGTGKTTTARLLAKGVNCLSEHKPCGVCENCKSIAAGTFMDVIEMDAASNRGIDNIRELRESVKYPPANGKKKVYIIDEVHMLSTEAFNAVLKTLEEPPENVMFILATTEPQKLPATVLSRCMRLDFKRVANQVLEDYFREICKSKGVDIEEGAITLISSNADGSVRDGISILDQLLSTGTEHITREQALSFLGASSKEALSELVGHIINGENTELIYYVDKLLKEGKDVRQLTRDLIEYYRGLLLSRYLDNPEDLLNLSSENGKVLKEQSKRMALADIRRGIMELSQVSLDGRYSTQPRILLEVGLMKLADKGDDEIRVIQNTVKDKKPENTAVGKDDKREDLTNEEQEIEVKAGDDNLWGKVFTKLEKEKVSFKAFRGCSRIKEMDDNYVVIEVDNEPCMKKIEDNIQEVASFLSFETGKTREVSVVQAQDKMEEKDDTSKTLKSIGKLMGDIPLEIED